MLLTEKEELDSSLSTSAQVYITPAISFANKPEMLQWDRGPPPLPQRGGGRRGCIQDGLCPYPPVIQYIKNSFLLLAVGGWVLLLAVYKDVVAPG